MSSERVPHGAAARVAADYSPADFERVGDYVEAAARHLGAPLLAYIDGGSGDDRSAARNTSAFSAWAILPDQLAPVRALDTSLELPGLALAHPLGLAPVAFAGLVHDRAELAVAEAAEASDTCLVAATRSSESIERIAERAGPRLALQLYWQDTPEATLALVRRAEAVGCRALFLSVDAAVQQPSRHALAAGFRMPPVRSGNELPERVRSTSLETAVARRVSAENLRWLIERSSLPVYVKGVLTRANAERVMEAGAAGIVVSNHGGRTVDGVPASLTVLPSIRAALGDSIPIWLDGGVRGGADAFKALALGADAVLVGRLQLYALACGGALGVAHMLRLLHEELLLHMVVCGCETLADVRARRPLLDIT